MSLEQCLQAFAGHYGKPTRQRECRKDSFQHETQRAGKKPSESRVNNVWPKGTVYSIHVRGNVCWLSLVYQDMMAHHDLPLLIPQKAYERKGLCDLGPYGFIGLSTLNTFLNQLVTLDWAICKVFLPPKKFSLCVRIYMMEINKKCLYLSKNYIYSSFWK